ncbi:SpoIIE family protein phosphatase [Streptomyces sp. NPDC003697]
MCDAHGVTSEPVFPAGSGAAPDLAALTEVVARQRAEMDRLRDLAAASAVLERAKGAIMALTGCCPDAAHEELVQRARAAGRTLTEECWLTLGALVPPPAAPAGGPGTSARTASTGVPSPASARVPSPGGPHDSAAGPNPVGDADGSAVLALPGPALARIRTPQGLARRLLKHFAPPPVDADAVMIYRRSGSGALDLIGHAGIDDTLADQWRHLPPVRRAPALEALLTRRPLWLEDHAADQQRYPLLGDTPGPWLSRAWLPVVADDTADVVIGVLRNRRGPFGPRTREVLEGAAQMCAGRLRVLTARPGRPVKGATEGAPGTVPPLFDALPGVSVLVTPLYGPSGEVEDCRIDAATPQTADVTGRTGRELVGLRLSECWPAVTGTPLWQGLTSTLVTGRPYEGEPFAQRDLLAGAQELSTYSVRAARLGDGLVVSRLRHESSDLQEQRLADLQRLGRLGWATWDLVTHETAWSPQLFALLARDPARGPVRLDGLADLAVPEDGPVLARAVRDLLADGKPFDVPFRVGTAGGVRHLRAVAEAMPDAEGVPVQVHGFLQDLTAQRNAELALVESERAMLEQHGFLQAERTLAGRLQHALLPLPRRPVRLSGLRVDIAYLPAQSGIHVGGDWFSAIELPDGDALFVVGDVAGHGIDAVATMAQLRFTAKGMIITGSSLTGALSRLNTLLLHSRDNHTTATMVLARYHPDERRLEWAQAGHPPPLLLRGGEARYLERPHGVLLGATASPRYEQAECLLEPGDRLLLYTDGLVERPGEPFDRGLDRLAEATTAHHDDDPGSLKPLLTALLGSERRDDVCVLDIRAPMEPA